MQRSQGRVRARESILPYSYGGSNGLLTQDNLDAQLWRRFGTSRLARTVCAAPTGAANMALYGKMPSVTYEDYPEAQLIVLWGVNPSASGIHLIPYIREAQKRGAKLVVIDPRSTPLARAADVHLAVRPGHRHRGGAGHSPVSLRERLRGRSVPARAHAPTPTSCASAPSAWTIERAADVAGIDADGARARRAPLRRELAGAGPVRLGSRAQPQRRQRRDGGARAAGRRRQVRRAGRRLLDEQLGVVGHRADVDRRARARHPAGQHEPPRPRPARYDDPPVQMLFVYNCNPVATVPDQQRIIRGTGARGSLHGSVRTGDDRHGALRRRRAAGHHVPRGVRFREVVRHHQPRSRRGRWSKPVGESRSNADVFGELCARLGLLRGGRTRRRTRLDGEGARLAARHDQRGPAERPPARAALWDQADPVRRRLPEHAGPQGPPLSRRISTRPRRSVSTTTSRIRQRTAFPLALISPSSEHTISSTLGELPRPDVQAPHASRRRRGARPGGSRSRAGVQRTGRSALHAARAADHPARHGQPGERALAAQRRATASPARRWCRTRSATSAAERASTTRASSVAARCRSA